LGGTYGLRLLLLLLLLLRLLLLLLDMMDLLQSLMLTTDPRLYGLDGGGVRQLGR